MMESTYKFVEIPISHPEFVNSAEGKLKLDDLIESLNQDVPNSVQFLNVIQMTLQKRYFTEDHKPVQLFSYEQVHNADRKDANGPVFIVLFVTAIGGKTITLIYYRDEPTSCMQNEFTNLLDWSKEIIFGTINMRLLPFLEQVGKSQGGNLQSNPNWTMYLPKNKWGSINRPSPVGVKVQQLKNSHAKIVHSHWKFADEGPTLQLFQNSIKHFVSAGVFLDNSNDSEDNSSEQPVSWIASMAIGTLNALHTSEQHRRKGYAELAMREASRQATNMGIFPICEVEYESTASKAMLDKIGFEVAFNACWIFYSPNSGTKLI